MAPSEADGVSWGSAHKVAFRFGFSYLCLYLYPFSTTLGWPWGPWIRWGSHETPWRQIVPWVATHVLHWADPVTVSFVPDSAYQYVKVFCLVLIAALATVVWSIIDRKRVAYPKLDQWMHWYVRLVLSFTLLGFGAGKIFSVQAPFPDLVSLLQPYGDFGGGGRFFWDFLGVSRGYQTLAGLLETFAGVLLLVPGMATLGALLAMGALFAVFTQSGFYGLPDKLVQLHLILFALFLLLPDIRRLMNVLLLNRATEPERANPLFRRRWLDYSVWGAQWALGAYIILLMISRGNTFLTELNNLPVTIPFYGIWRVDEFTADGQVRSPVLTDTMRWQRVIFDGAPGTPASGVPQKMIATIQEMNGTFSPYVASVDSTNAVLSLQSPSTADLNGLARIFIHGDIRELQRTQLKYNRVSPDTIVLEGTVNGHRLVARLRKEERQFALRGIRFRWIVEDKDIVY